MFIYFLDVRMIETCVSSWNSLYRFYEVSYSLYIRNDTGALNLAEHLISFMAKCTKNVFAN